MIHPIESDLLRDYETLTLALSVAEARRRLAWGRYGVVVDEAGAPLACLREANLANWPDGRTLESLRDRWPPLFVLLEAEALALGVSAIATFFQDELYQHERRPVIYVVEGVVARPIVF